MNRLKELRKKNKISQKKLSEIFKVTEKTISRWENEEVQIKKDVAQELAKYFNVSVPYLLGYSDFKSKEELRNNVEDSNFFGDVPLGDNDKDYYRNFDIKLGLSLLEHYHKETDLLLNHILGAYIQKDTEKILTDSELKATDDILNFITKQNDTITEGGKFLKEFLRIIKQKYNINNN